MDSGCPSQEAWDAAKVLNLVTDSINIRERERSFREGILPPEDLQRKVGDKWMSDRLLESIAREEEKSMSKAASSHDLLREHTERLGPRRATLEYLRSTAHIPRCVLAEALGLTESEMKDVEEGFARLEVVHLRGATILDRIRRNSEKIEDKTGGSLDVILFGRDELDAELSRMESREQRLNARIMGLAGFEPVEGKRYVVAVEVTINEVGKDRATALYVPVTGA